jgi:hypothetical protein
MDAGNMDFAAFMAQAESPAAAAPPAVAASHARKTLQAHVPVHHIQRDASGTRVPESGEQGWSGEPVRRNAGLHPKPREDDESPPKVDMGDTVILHCRWLSFLRDLNCNIAVIAVIWCQNDSVALGYPKAGRDKSRGKMKKAGHAAVASSPTGRHTKPQEAAIADEDVRGVLRSWEAGAYDAGFRDEPVEPEPERVRKGLKGVSLAVGLSAGLDQSLEGAPGAGRQLRAARREIGIARAQKDYV